METVTEKKFLLQRGPYTLKSFGGDCSKRWYLSYYKEFSNGVRKRLRVYGYINRLHEPVGRYAAAVKLLNTLETEGAVQRFEANYMQQLLSRYMDDKAPYLRNKTRATYATKVNTFIEYCTKKRVDSLKPVSKAFCAGFLNSLKRQNTTVNTYRATLFNLWELLRKDKLVETNPWAEVPKRPELKVSKAPFSVSQMAMLRESIAPVNGALWVACQLQYYCFIRPGELRLLKVENFNVDEGFIEVPGLISKNKKTQIVTVPAVFLPVLREWVKGLPQNYYLANRLPAPVGRDYFLKQHAKHLKRLGFSSKYSFYSWKHSGAVMAVRAGINLKDLQLQMRHHSLDQLNEYLKAMGVLDSADLRARFPGIG